METDNSSEQRLLNKIRRLPPEKVSEVEDFIDFLYQKNADHSLVIAAAKLSESVLHEIWDNPADAEYDNL
ncbi:Protein of unknown function (DUF2281) [Nostoc sp. PCC 7524]|uniref:DUF2281 domain-containing protein n=1 Tax=Nostoc sp. (strain ATCC 29411 / PCC 7524) TaxID=28072 RepID=UPI00029F1454|nr:DUF2281 domain-containing protein [Nostoc sp. PCC 7524]AFY49158.1 Protein of unknown function (DUF2281) [Nostoc sp. PCC 7524]